VLRANPRWFRRPALSIHQPPEVNYWTVLENWKINQDGPSPTPEGSVFLIPFVGCNTNTLLSCTSGGTVPPRGRSATNPRGFRVERATSHQQSTIAPFSRVEETNPRGFRVPCQPPRVPPTSPLDPPATTSQLFDRFREQVPRTCGGTCW
jgi:hypothetical protein